MAKKDGTKADKPKTGGPLPHQSGHNSELNDDEKAAEFFRFKKKWSAAKSALSAVEEEAKTALGKYAIRDFRTAIALETPEGEERIKERIEAQLRVARWNGLALGSQAEMFGDDRTPAVDRAFAEGKRDGLAGDPCKPAYAPETEQYREYMRGFHDGQAVLAKGIKKTEAQVETTTEAPADDDRDVRPRHLKLAETEHASDVQALPH